MDLQKFTENPPHMSFYSGQHNVWRCEICNSKTLSENERIKHMNDLLKTYARFSVTHLIGGPLVRK